MKIGDSIIVKVIGACKDFCNFNSQLRYPGKALTNNRHSARAERLLKSFNNITSLNGKSVLSLNDFDPMPGKGTAFSGIYDIDTGAILMYPSGSTKYKGGQAIPSDKIVKQGGGHAEVLLKYKQYTGVGDNFNQIGFTVFYEEVGKVQVEFLSRSVNRTFNLKYYGRSRPTGDLNQDFIAPKEFHDDIAGELKNVLNVDVTVRDY